MVPAIPVTQETQGSVDESALLANSGTRSTLPTFSFVGSHRGGFSFPQRDQNTLLDRDRINQQTTQQIICREPHASQVLSTCNLLWVIVVIAVIGVNCVQLGLTVRCFVKGLS